jgi:NTE family protein
MLQGLYEWGIRPDLLVGTSAGALNGAFAASRPPTVDTALALQRVWRGLCRSHVFPTSPLTAGLGFLGVRDHAVPASGLRRIVRDHLACDRLEDADTPLHIVAADVLTGEEVVLSRGPVVDAVLASAAIPGVFPPVPFEGRLLVDGGIVNNTPISHAVALGADQVFVLPALGAQRLDRAPRGAVAAGITAVARAIVRRFDDDVARYRDVVELTVLPAPELAGILPTDFGHADELIEHGLAGARRVLERPRAPVALRAAA